MFSVTHSEPIVTSGGTVMVEVAVPRSGMGVEPEDEVLVPTLSFIAPANADTQRREVERLASTADLTRLEELSAAELGKIVERLTEAEKETSHRRRRIQAVMDSITGELIRRYREGKEDPTAILSN